MFYMDKGLAALGLPRLGKTMAWYYAVCIILGCLGIGCMFQANQAYVQFVNFRDDVMPFAGLRESGLGIGGIPYTMHDMQIDKMMVVKEPA